jgi:hypothetical protein
MCHGRCVAYISHMHAYQVLTHDELAWKGFCWDCSLLGSGPSLLAGRPLYSGNLQSWPDQPCSAAVVASRCCQCLLLPVISK